MVPKELRKALEKRLDEYMRCGHTVMVRQCGACGVDRAGSGAFNRSCKTRSCPSCSWVRSKEMGRFFESAFDAIEGPSDYAWRYIVVTIRYDPEDPADLSAAALRSRARIAARIGKGLWDGLLSSAKVSTRPALSQFPGHCAAIEGRPGVAQAVAGFGRRSFQGTAQPLKDRVARARTAMLRTIECGERGHVHLNLLYFGPPVDKRELEITAAALECRAGWCKIQNLDRDPSPPGKWAKPKAEDPRGSKASLKKVARYVAKGMHSSRSGGTLDEKWLSGENVASTIDPVLAARWEIATYRMQLTQRYGALRGLKSEKRDQIEIEAKDAEVVCGCCGTVGEWRSVARNTEDWIQRCHEAGWVALSRTVESRAGPTDN